MQLGMIGLGRMGANMVRRLTAAGHDCVVHDVERGADRRARSRGATGARRSTSSSPASTAAGDLDHGPGRVRRRHARALGPLLDDGDIVIDGGNSWYHLDVDRSTELAPPGIHYVDVGTSGGVHGLERGYCLMIGGDDDAVGGSNRSSTRSRPGVGAAERTPGRDGDVAPEERGWLHCGPSGAGHFVKMVHNGIEYGLMAAYAEGLNVLAKANIGSIDHEADAETAPLEAAEYYRTTSTWRRSPRCGAAGR